MDSYFARYHGQSKPCYILSTRITPLPTSGDLYGLTVALLVVIIGLVFFHFKPPKS